MATIYYSLSAKRNSNNQQEIMIRFTHGRINQRSKSNLFVEADYWDDIKSEIIIPRFRIIDPHQRELRDYLANLQGNLGDLSLLIQNSFNELDKSAVPRDWLRTLIDGHNYPEKYLSEEEINRGRDFFELFDLFLSQRRISPVRHDGYLVLKRALQRFELFVQRTSEPTFKLSVEEMDLDTISDFESFLTHEHYLYKEYRDVYDSFPTFGMRRMPAPRPRGNNTLNNLFKMFKAFFNWCYSSEITDNQPFRNHTTKPEVYGTPYYITIEERNRLYELDLSERPNWRCSETSLSFNA